MKLPVALLLVGFTSGVLAQEDGRWQFVALTGDDTVVSIDTRTLELEGGVATVWVQYFYKAGSLRPYFASRPAAKRLQREEFHCKRMQVGVLSYAVFADDGANLAQGTAITPVFSPVVPDTTSEAVWNAVCK